MDRDEAFALAEAEAAEIRRRLKAGQVPPVMPGTLSMAKLADLLDELRRIAFMDTRHAAVHFEDAQRWRDVEPALRAFVAQSFGRLWLFDCPEARLVKAARTVLRPDAVQAGSPESGDSVEVGGDEEPERERTSISEKLIKADAGMSPGSELVEWVGRSDDCSHLVPSLVRLAGDATEMGMRLSWRLVPDADEDIPF